MIQDKIKDIKSSPFFKDIVHSVITRGIYIFLGFITTIFITRSFSVEDFGEYSFLLSLALTIFQLTHLGFSSSNTYFVVHNKRYLRFLIGNSNLLSLIVGALSLMFLLILNPIYLHRDFSLIIITAIIVPFQVSSLVNKGLMLGINQVKEANNLELYARILYSIILVLIIWKTKSVFMLLFAYALQMAILAYTSFKTIDKAFIQKQKASFKLFIKTSNYSIRIYLTLLLAFLVLRIDVYFIEKLLGNKELGIYSLAATLASNLILIIQVIIPLLVPKLGEIKEKKLQLLKLRNIVFYATIILILINLVFYFFGQFLINLVFGNKYTDSFSVFIILLLASSLISIESIIAQYYATIGKIKFLISYWIITLATNIVLNYLWIPKYGIKGAAWASFVSYGLILLLVLIKILRDSREFYKKQ